MGTATPWGGDEKPGSVGIPFPNTDLKIVDLETGKKEMKIGETGEICFKVPGDDGLLQETGGNGGGHGGRMAQDGGPWASWTRTDM